MGNQELPPKPDLNRYSWYQGHDGNRNPIIYAVMPSQEIGTRVAGDINHDLFIDRGPTSAADMLGKESVEKVKAGMKAQGVENPTEVMREEGFFLKGTAPEETVKLNPEVPMASLDGRPDGSWQVTIRRMSVQDFKEQSGVSTVRVEVPMANFSGQAGAKSPKP